MHVTHTSNEKMERSFRSVNNFGATSFLSPALADFAMFLAFIGACVRATQQFSDANRSRSHGSESVIDTNARCSFSITLAPIDNCDPGSRCTKETIR